VLSCDCPIHEGGEAESQFDSCHNDIKATAGTKGSGGIGVVVDIGVGGSNFNIKAGWDGGAGLQGGNKGGNRDVAKGD
jgi:hypothetical protein